MTVTDSTASVAHPNGTGSITEQLSGSVDLTSSLNVHVNAIDLEGHAVKLTYTDLLIKIIAQALTRHPRLNAGWVNDVVVANPAVNIALVVAVPDGLLVPVISHADELGIGAIAVGDKRRNRRHGKNNAQAPQDSLPFSDNRKPA